MNRGKSPHIDNAPCQSPKRSDTVGAAARRWGKPHLFERISTDELEWLRTTSVVDLSTGGEGAADVCTPPRHPPRQPLRRPARVPMRDAGDQPQARGTIRAIENGDNARSQLVTPNHLMSGLRPSRTDCGRLRGQTAFAFTSVLPLRFTARGRVSHQKETRPRFSSVRRRVGRFDDGSNENSV
jgi:hypothetical protein